MLERKVIVNIGPFRHTFISDCTLPTHTHRLLTQCSLFIDLPKFTHTLALSKLASFLDETQTESKKPQKPFLIAAYNERKNSYLVVGFVGFGIRGKAKIKCVPSYTRLPLIGCPPLTFLTNLVSQCVWQCVPFGGAGCRRAPEATRLRSLGGGGGEG